MFFSRIAVIFLSAHFGCRQCSKWATAFGSTSVPSSHRRLQSKILATLDTAEHEEDKINASREELMDQLVLLYSTVSQRTKFGNITEADFDALKLRSKELSSLFEDAVFDSRGIAQDGIMSAELIPETTVEEEKEPETIYEVSQALDEQILFGYQSTFTEDELEDWIERINGLQQKLQTQLDALPPDSNNVASTEQKAPPTPLDRMHSRLDSLRTLIDPEGSSILRLPLARPAIARKPKSQSYNRVSEPAVPTYSPPIIPFTELADENEEVKAETETAAIDIADTIVVPPPLLSSVEKPQVFVDDSTTATTNGEEEKNPTAMSQNEGGISSTKLSDVVFGENGTIKTTKIEADITVGVNADHDGVKNINFENAPVGAPMELSHAISEKEEGSTKNIAEKEQALVDEENSLLDTAFEITNLKSLEANVDKIKLEPVAELSTFDDSGDDEVKMGIIDASPDYVERELSVTNPDPVSSASETETMPPTVDGTGAHAVEIFPSSEDKPITTAMDTDGMNAEEPQTDASATVPIQHAAQEPPSLDDERDIVTPLVATAALSAAAITANPLIVAGVALGPIIRDAIASAKSRTREAKESSMPKKNQRKSTLTPKKDTSKPNKRSVFASKENREAKKSSTSEKNRRKNTFVRKKNLSKLSVFASKKSNDHDVNDDENKSRPTQ